MYHIYLLKQAAVWMNLRAIMILMRHIVTARVGVQLTDASAMMVRELL